jgi:hypothetical protein
VNLLAKIRRRARAALLDFVLVVDVEYFVVIETIKEIQHESLVVVEHVLHVSAANPTAAIDRALDIFEGPQPWYSIAVYDRENSDPPLERRWNIDQRVATTNTAK